MSRNQRGTSAWLTTQTTTIRLKASASAVFSDALAKRPGSPDFWSETSYSAEDYDSEDESVSDENQYLRALAATWLNRALPGLLHLSESLRIPLPARTRIISPRCAEPPRPLLASRHVHHGFRSRHHSNIRLHRAQRRGHGVARRLALS